MQESVNRQVDCGFTVEMSIDRKRYAGLKNDSMVMAPVVRDPKIRTLITVDVTGTALEMPVPEKIRDAPTKQALIDGFTERFPQAQRFVRQIASAHHNADCR